MVIEIFLALFLGVFAGTLTGLAPGIHINLVGAILISLSVYFLELTTPIILVIFIVAMSITHTFVDFIPSVFLGAPNEDTVLSVLPGHELLKQGRGYEAISLANYGGIAGILILILISPVFIFLSPKFENIIYFLVPILLIISVFLLIFTEQNKINAIIIFLLSGFLGIAVLNSNVSEPFLPMLSGLFGSSSLIISIKTKIQIPKQNIQMAKIRKSFFKPLVMAGIASPICSFLPGIGSGQAAVISSSVIKPAREEFLVLLGAVNTLGLGVSFIVLYIFGKTRTGMAVVISQLLENITLNHVMIILTAGMLTGILSFYLTLFLAKYFSKFISRVNYTYLSIIILLAIFSVVFIFSGFLGIFILIISTATGLFGILSDVRRINLMGCLVVPVVLLYLV